MLGHDENERIMGEHGRLLAIYEVPADPVNAQALSTAQITGPAFNLLRPDGHIGLAGTHAHAADIVRYLEAYDLWATRAT
jgi:hypothetical protein